MKKIEKNKYSIASTVFMVMTVILVAIPIIILNCAQTLQPLTVNTIFISFILSAAISLFFAIGCKLTSENVGEETNIK